MDLLFLVAGLVLMVAGAEALVRGAARVAGALGIRALVIGLTVVAFGTSAPELAVSVKATLAGQPDIAVGNVVGSNIFNVLFILGLSALIVPLVVSAQLIRLDVPLMIGLSVLLYLMCRDGSVGRVDGALLVTGLVAYVVFLIRLARREPDPDAAAELPPPGGSMLRNVLLIPGGLVLLVLGSRWFVDGAVGIALWMGVSEVVVGLTIVAAGTSMPEVVTSIIAALRGERDIAVGNVVGSNIFNIMGVLGIAALVAPDGVGVARSIIAFDLPVMIAVAVACLPIFFTGGMIGRWKGAMLFGYYCAYAGYLVLAASDHDAQDEFSAVMLYFVIPLTVVTLVAVSVREFRSRMA
ncbi:MAG: calcium/sodium antiporter [Pseudomonadales bacterium]|nr:calcium/sodium antiporter [Pseudomonadales bacterium]